MDSTFPSVQFNLALSILKNLGTAFCNCCLFWSLLVYTTTYSAHLHAAITLTSSSNLSAVAIMRPQLAAWISILLADLVAAAPTVSFPINSQVPPVARIGQPFAFVFSPSTFTSSFPLTYTLANAPRWLSIDSSNRRLFGTPSEGDVGPGEVVGIPVNLVATDQTGSTTHEATLVVSRNRGPNVEIPLEQQIPNFGIFSSPYSILSGPDAPFSFALDQKTFTSVSNSRLGYCAVMADNTPLPAWVSFDPDKLSFSGRTPPLDSLIQPPQRFAFHLVASDVAGFAGAALQFDLVVGVHQISAEETTIILTAVPGKPVSYTKLKDIVKIDGKPPSTGEVTLDISSDMPAWLSVNKDSWDITGTPTEKSTSTNFTITFQDNFSDTLNITMLVDVESQATKAAGVFKGSLPILTATPGQHFSFDFRPHLVSPDDIEISVSQGDSASWIRFDAGRKTLSGHPPSVSKDTIAALEVSAQSRSSNKSDKLSMKLLIRAAEHSTPNSDTPSDADSTPLGGVLPVGGDAAPSGKVNVVLLGILLPTILSAFVVAFAVFWCYRRQKAKRRPRLTTRDISGPLPGSFVITSNGPNTAPSLPDISHNFDRSFTVGDVFTPEKKMYVESRSSFLTKGGAPTSLATVKLLPPSVRSKHGGAGGGRIPFLGGGSFGAMWLGSSLASIAERSVNDEAGEMDARTAGLLGNKTTGSFQDGIEINIPSVQGTPRSRYNDSPNSPYQPHAMASPRSRSSSAGSDPETFPLRAESRLAHYGPPEITRRFMWPWFRGNNSRSRSSKLRWGSRTHSKQPSTSTVDTFAYKRTGQSIDLGYADAGMAPEVTPPPRARLIGAVPLARPVTRRGPTDASLEGMILSHGQSGMSIPMNAPPTTPGGPGAPSVASQKDISLPPLPDWRESPDDVLGLSYDDLVKNSSFHPSATWQSISTNTNDEWVDETVVSMDTPQRETAKKDMGTPSNWAVLQDSPFIKDWDAGIDSPSPVSIGPGDASTPAGNEKREQQPTSSRTQPSNISAAVGYKREFQRDQSGLPGRSESKGVSLMSGKSREEESDFAVYI
ncbi:polarity establishment/cellular polarization [Podospora pseudoanserina]|uniref:Polarity establishment/cellular polarization n=1 Tax=Podospora pseudoanserina TaxID=2609844 RepID=A0ABR0IF16_9PEZI|nr:polarity establishment/cellular polarization [Podospora pseudoanserina]